MYINAPYPNNEQQYLNSPTYNQPSKPVDEPKRGFWDYFSFIIWPKWLFGSSNTEQENQYAYYSQAGPAYPPRPYSSSSFSSGQHLASSSNAYRPKPPLPPPPPPPHYSPTHQQGLYQVPAPNSKYPHVPQAVKYPNSGYQSPIFPKQSNDKVNQYQITSKAYTSATQLPTTRYPISSLTEIIKSQQPYTTTKSPVPIPPIYGPPDQSPFIPSQPAYSIYLVPSKPVQPPQGSNYQYNDPSQINRNPFGQHYRGVQGYGTYSDPSSLYNGYDYPTGVRPPVYNAPPTMQQQDSVYSPSVMALPHNPIYLNHQATPKPDCDHVKKTSIPPTNTHLRTPNDNTKALVIEIITSNVTESLINTTEDLQNSTSSLSSLPTSSTTAPSTIANVVS